jgi:SAM-dependent methyltransferase
VRYRTGLVVSPTALTARRGRQGAYVDLDLRPYGGHAKLVEAVGKNNRVLDVGCSTGYLAKVLTERGNRVVGIELDPEAADSARQWCEEVFVGDVETIDISVAPGRFDVLLCADVVEHMHDPEAFLRRAARMLRPGGRVVLSTPNIANWTIRLSLLAGRFTYTDRGILDRGHTRLFTLRTLKECLASAGYQIEALDFTVPVPLIGTRVVEGAAHAFGRLRPTLFAYQFVVTAAVMPSASLTPAGPS